MEIINNYISKMKASHHFIKSGVWKDIKTLKGKKYVKVLSVLSNNQQCVIEFIDPMNGKIYKAASAKQKGRWIKNL